MPEHYTKNTVSATCWCNRCGRATEHRVDDGRRGPCLRCLAGLETNRAVAGIRDAARQEELFQEG